MGIPEADRRDFFIYVDEFHAFTTNSLTTRLSEATEVSGRGRSGPPVLSQLDPAIRDAIFVNAATIVAFRVSGADAQFLACEFAPRFEAEDFISLSRFHAYVGLMIDDETSQPFYR